MCAAKMPFPKGNILISFAWEVINTSSRINISNHEILNNQHSLQKQILHIVTQSECYHKTHVEIHGNCIFLPEKVPSTSSTN